MGPKRAKKIIIESSTPTPPPPPPTPKADEVISSSPPPPMADTQSSSSLPPAADDDEDIAHSKVPIDLKDLEDETEEENADAEESAAPTTAAAATTTANKKDPIIELIKTYYAAAPYLPSGAGLATQHELEVRFGTRAIYQQITKTDYDAVVKMAKSFGFVVKDDAGTSSGQYSLRIQNEFVDARTGSFKVSDNIRTEIYGMDAIQLYCRTNDLQAVLKSMRNAVRFTNKHSAYRDNVRVPNVVMEDFNFIVSYKLEDGVKGPVQGYIAENWSKFKKYFRYLNRVTFVHPDFPILLDMSIVKSSPRVVQTKAQQGRQQQQGYQMFHTTGEAGIFTTAPETYEIEIEVDAGRIGPGTAFDSVEKITVALKQAIKLVLSGLQHTNYPIGYSEQSRIIGQYGAMLFGGAGNKGTMTAAPRRAPFIGPSSITLQIPNVAPIDPNTTIPNIRADFVVTEKADGVRHMLYIGSGGGADGDNKNPEAGKVYLINTNMVVIFTGARTNNKNIWGSLLDGELIKHAKDGTWINLFAAFDIYYLKGVDVRAHPFINVSGESERTQYRYNLLKSVVESANMVNIVESMKKINVAPLRLECKRFYSTVAGIKDAAKDGIFAACAHILQQEKDGVFPYTIDGLIFTHTTFGVGADAAGKAGDLKKDTWRYSFKWKPTEYNTIDFLASIVKGKAGEDVVNIKFEDGQNADQMADLLQYKTVQLFSRYNAAKHGIINACQMIYDDTDVNAAAIAAAPDDRHTVTQFIPTSPYDPDADVAFIPLKMDNGGDMQMYTTEGDIITDKAVVEFAYDFNRERGWRWIPLRVRYDKPENAYDVANDIWKNMHNPVTTEMITTGLNIPNIAMIDADVYYNKDARATVFMTENLKGFHNAIKSVLINAVAGNGRDQTLIDMACGKAGDLSKWTHAGFSFVFGIDLSRDNLENAKDGACVRYIRAKRNTKVIPDCLFVQGNSAFNIRSGEAMMGDKAVQIGRAVFGQGEKSESRLGRGVFRSYGRGANGFNVASMQFALHYMFESEATLTAYVRNLAECVAIGGYFIATFYDGKTVFNMLRGKANGEMTSLFEGDRMLWGLVKRFGADVTNETASTAEALPDSVESLGLKIDVFQESINQWIPEYLVNFAYFIRVMEEFGFILPTLDEAREMGLPNATGLFDALHAQILSQQGKMGAADAAAMSASELKISFLNRYCVFKKVRAVEAAKIKITTLGDYKELPRGYIPSSAALEPTSAAATTTPTAVIAPPSKPRIRRVKKNTIQITDEAEGDAPTPLATMPAGQGAQPATPVPLEEMSQTTKDALVSAIVEKKSRRSVPRKKIVIDED